MPGTRSAPTAATSPRGVVGVEEIHVGERAVVHAKQDGERLEATEVKLGAGK